MSTDVNAFRFITSNQPPRLSTLRHLQDGASYVCAVGATTGQVYRDNVDPASDCRALVPGDEVSSGSSDPHAGGHRSSPGAAYTANAIDALGFAEAVMQIAHSKFTQAYPQLDLSLRMGLHAVSFAQNAALLR